MFARTKVNQTISLYNHETESWEDIDTRAANNFFDRTDNIPVTGDLTCFVDQANSTVVVKVLYKSTNPRQQFASNTGTVVRLVGQ